MEQGVHYFRFKKEKNFLSFILLVINQEGSWVIFVRQGILKFIFTRKRISYKIRKVVTNKGIQICSTNAKIALKVGTM